MRGYLRRPARSSAYFFTRFAQAVSFCKAASFLFCVGTNCARCVLHWSTDRAEFEEAGAVPEAQAVTLRARREMQDIESKVFMNKTFWNDWLIGIGA